MTGTPFGALVVFGGGVMGSAVVRGGLAAGVLEAARTTVCEPDRSKCAALAALGVRVTHDHGAAVQSSGPDAALLLAVKPQSFAELASQLRGAGVSSGRLVVSVMAGVRGERIAAELGIGARLVRAMPNTAAAVRRSMTAIAPGPRATEADLARVRALMSAVGKTVTIAEPLMDAATAVVGSGPAYVYVLAEAMMRGAREAGFDETTADEMVRGTIGGAAAMLEHHANMSPADLRSMVTSKGGTTAAAVDVLHSAGVPEAVVRAILAARDRGRELAGPVDSDD
ncbi:MAG: pyrroline-5-carboxylate reductase [Phycisphaeraceae bacterium]|nr:pyrroline-5-carboxylate reductase [Phycisphaeraceae bacterium]